MKQLRSYHAGLVKDNNGSVRLHAVNIYECIMLSSRFLQVFLLEASSLKEHFIFVLVNSTGSFPYLQHFC